VPTIRPASPAAIDQAAAILRRGGLVGIPTETVYGLACLATDIDAVAAIFEAKGRPSFNPLIVHVADADALPELVRDLPTVAAALIDRFWPGPLTLVLPKTDVIDDLVTAGLPTVAVRCPDHPVARKLIERVGAPLAAPSANRYMHVSPTAAEHVLDLGERVELILDDGPCRTGIESTVIGFAGDGRPCLLRHGGLAVDRIEAIAGPLAKVDAFSDDRTPMPGPGMTRRHYAPQTPLRIVDPKSLATSSTFDPATTALLLFSGEHRPTAAGVYRSVVTLSERGDTHEAATRLFAALREIDAIGAKLILATCAPDTGLGPAINDRLTRAAAT
jgi:L-threonylcarbamoyladenylate synthase